MSIFVDKPPSETDRRVLATKTVRPAGWVFAAWCMRREVTTVSCYLAIVQPLVCCTYWLWVVSISEVFMSAGTLPGSLIFHHLALTGLFMIALGGMMHISSAVCWELSRELRDLVRLTGLSPVTLLWCRTSARLLTVLFSVVALAPVAMFLHTHGGTPSQRWVVVGCWMFLAIVLSTGFAMLAGVSSSRASNPESQANGTVTVLMGLYHLVFWSASGAILIWAWAGGDVGALPQWDSVRGGFGSLPQNSAAFDTASFITGFAPGNSFYQAFLFPDEFSILAPSYWIHLLTGVVAIWLSMHVMRNRFRVTTSGDSDAQSVTESNQATLSIGRDRPRCGEQPFVWKDYYILGRDSRSRLFWNIFAVLATFGVIASMFYGIDVQVASSAIGIFVVVVAIRFDGLLSSEFREKTWLLLMLLPLDPWQSIISKVRVAVWERRWLLLPVVTAAVIALKSSPGTVVATAVTGSIVFILLIETSIIAQLNSKQWWKSLFFCGLVSLLIGGNVLLCATLGVIGGSALMAGPSLIVAFFFYLYLNRRLWEWADE